MVLPNQPEGTENLDDLTDVTPVTPPVTTPPVVTPVIPEPSGASELQVNFNALNDKGERLYFDQSYVKTLRQEAEGHRKDFERATSQLETIQTKEEAARNKLLEEQGNYKELYEGLVSKNQELEEQATQARIENLRMSIATELGIPPALASRLQGGTEEEIRADAQTLIPLVASSPQRIAPTTSPVPSPTKVGKTRQEQRAEFFSPYQESGIFGTGGEVTVAPVSQQLTMEG